MAEKDIKDNPGGIIIFSKNKLSEFIFNKSLTINLRYLMINSGNIIKKMKSGNFFFNLLKMQVIKKTYRSTKELKNP